MFHACTSIFPNMKRSNTDKCHSSKASAQYEKEGCHQRQTWTMVS